MDTEFQQGYKKALEDFLKKFSNKKTFTKEDLNSFYQDYKKESSKPKPTIIFFTKRDKNGDLIFDREKTEAYKKDPKSLAKLPTLIAISKTNPHYQPLLDAMTSKKTEEMLAEENRFIFGNLEIDSSKVTNKYLNTLGQLIMQINQDESLMNSLCEICDVGPEEKDPIKKIVNTCIEHEWLFLLKKGA